MIAERFREYVERADSGCWLWTGVTNSQGYGYFWDGDRMVRAHRWAYEHEVGPIPDGFELDHLCSTRTCVRVDHLEAVTHAENVARGQSGVWQTLKTHCPQQHPYSEQNTYLSPRNKRECRTCKRDAKRRHRVREQGVLA